MSRSISTCNKSSHLGSITRRIQSMNSNPFNPTPSSSSSSISTSISISSVNHQRHNLSSSSPIPKSPPTFNSSFNLNRNLILGRRYFSSSLRLSQPRLKPYLLADVGEGITECEIIKWFVQPGAQISEFDPLVEVQSDKASVEITSRYSGVIKSLEYKEGEVAKVGNALCHIEMEAEDGDAVSNEASSSSSSSSSVSSAEKPVQDDKSRLEAQDEKSTINETALEGFRNSVASEGEKNSGNRTTVTSFKSTSDSNSPTLAVPAVRRLSKENGIDLNLIQGSGKDGRVTKEDVLRFIEDGRKNGQSGSKSASSSSSSSTNVDTSEGKSTGNQVKEIKLSSIRKAMFRSMTSSLKIPHFGYSHNLDLTNLTLILDSSLTPNIPPQYKSGELSAREEEMLKRIGIERVEENRRLKKLTMLSLLLKALDFSMREFPLFRSELISPSMSGSDSEKFSISEIASKSHLKQHSKSIASIALSTPSGLLTPTLPALNDLNVYEIASQMRYLQMKSSLSPLSNKDSSPQGVKGTVTLSNIGSIASGLFAAPILPPTGQLAIAAIGRTQEIPVFKDQTPEWKCNRQVDILSDEERRKEKDTIVRRSVTGVSWSADHRIVEGAELAAFAQRWKDLVENPASWLGLVA